MLEDSVFGSEVFSAIDNNSIISDCFDFYKRTQAVNQQNFINAKRGASGI